MAEVELLVAVLFVARLVVAELLVSAEHFLAEEMDKRDLDLGGSSSMEVAETYFSGETLFLLLSVFI
jgi:hypothetical protein